MVYSAVKDIRALFIVSDTHWERDAGWKMVHVTGGDGDSGTICGDISARNKGGSMIGDPPGVVLD